MLRQSLMTEPDERGYFGRFGGRFVPESLIPALDELTEAFYRLRNQQKFQEELADYNRHYGGRPSPLYFAKRLTEYAGGARIFLKREDLIHGGAHKFNNAMGQGLLTKYLGKKRIIAETGAGQHGTATAMIGALLGIETVIYMGEKDIERQQPNVQRMRLMGADVVPVKTGSRTLKDAVNEALRDWVRNVETTHYLIGSVVGPHPFPLMVRHFQSVIGQEVKHDFLEYFGELPDLVMACVGGGSNAAGSFHPFIEDTKVKLLGVEAGGKGDQANSRSITCGSQGILHGSMSYLLQNEEGQVKEAHSVSAGLDYPGVGPELAYWNETGRVDFTYAADKEALDAMRLLSRLEGIIPALESSHAIARAIDVAKTMDKDERIVVTLSGRGDKDLETIQGKMT